MRRREFITMLGGAAAAWPLAARAQKVDRVRWIGVLQGLNPNDPEYLRRIGAFRRGLRELGWTDGRNVAMQIYYTEGRVDRLPTLAAELVQAKVDVIVTQGTETAQAARKATSTIPIVMAQIGDAVGAGLVASLARPGRTADQIRVCDQPQDRQGARSRRAADAARSRRRGDRIAPPSCCGA